MKFLIASLALCACVCYSAAGVGGYGPVNSYSVILGPGAPQNTVVPVYNIPVPPFQPIYSNVPVYGNIGLPGYGNVAGPAQASSASAASSSVRDGSYASPIGPY